MATTRIISMHVNQGKTIANCLADRIDYSKNPDKTQGGELISAYECDPKTADAEFLYSKRQYKTLTGREQQSNCTTSSKLLVSKSGSVKKILVLVFQ